MNEGIPGWMSPASVIFAVAAVALAGFGGLMGHDRIRFLFGGLAFFCLAMLWVFLMIAAGRLSDEEQGGLFAGLGALAGLCLGLGAPEGVTLPGLAFYSVGFGVLGFVVWARIMRQG